MGKVRFAWLCAAILLTSSCLNLNSWDVDGSVASARNDGGTTNPKGEMPSQTVDAPQAPQPEDGGNNPPSPMDGCQAGFHSCSGTCVDSKLAINCGVACTPCPGITGGEATCDGIRCGVQCPAGQKPCIDKCVAESVACEDKCPPGQNPCNGICVDRGSVSTCGTACVTCPTSPNGQTSCDGDKCVLACNTGYHACGNTCASNSDPLTCGSGCTPCPIPGGGSATCNGTQCGTTCPAKTKLCNGVCLEEVKPCGGTCPAGTHNCNDNCVSNTDTANCGSSCMPCQPPAKGQATCNGTTCGFNCQSGSHRCGDECKDNRSVDSCGTSSCSSCPTSPSATATCDGAKCDLKCNGSLFLCNGVCQQCCNDGQCGNGKACSNGNCVQACPTGQACTQGISPCHVGKYACSSTTATPQCNESGVDDSKAGCSSGNHCQNGSCVPNCVAGGDCGDACNPGSYECINGVRKCMTQPKSDGSPCGGSNVCSSGKCVASCKPDVDCTSDKLDPCTLGKTACTTATAKATCVPAGNRPNGVSCKYPKPDAREGPNGICHDGSCFPCGALSEDCCQPSFSCKAGCTCDRANNQPFGDCVGTCN
jgi:hypothetical protein